MTSNTIVSDLRNAVAVTDGEINAAVGTVLTHLATEAYTLANAWTLARPERSPGTRPPGTRSSPIVMPTSPTGSAPRSCWRIR